MNDTGPISGDVARQLLVLARWRGIEGGGNGNHVDERRWPPWLSILFILVCSLALWALIIWGLWQLIRAG